MYLSYDYHSLKTFLLGSSCRVTAQCDACQLRLRNTFTYLLTYPTYLTIKLYTGRR